jgi:hypothetical protein
MLDAIKLALATWRLSSLLVQESGPFNVFAALREKTTFGGMLDCVWCTSIWVAALLLLVSRVARWPVDVLAVSAAAIWIDKELS